MKRLPMVLLALLLTPVYSPAHLPIGIQPARIVLKGTMGGHLDGSPWFSMTLTGKVYTLMYIDPDEKDLNRHVEQALKGEGFPKEHYGSIAVINMNATWKPEWAILAVLKDKQKEFPHTAYVLDKGKALVKKWRLKDDSYDVVTFDMRGRVIFSKDGKLSDADVKQLIQAIWENL